MRRNLVGDYVRHCPNTKANPNCWGELRYKQENRMIDAEKRRALCGSCSRLGIPHTEEGRAKISNSLKGDKNPFFGTNRIAATVDASGDRTVVTVTLP